MNEPTPYAGQSRDTHLEYEAVLANASIGIAFTRDRKFSLCNPKFAEMFGWAAGELIGQSGEVVYPSSDSYQALGDIAIPILATGRQLDVEWEMRRKDSATFLCRLTAKAIDPKNTQAGTVWIAEDITERKRLADAVAQRVAEQGAILDTVPVGIVFVRDRVIARCNPSFERLLGYAQGELNGQPTRSLHADDAFYDAVSAGYAALASGRSFSAEGPMRRKDGSSFAACLTGTAADPLDPGRGTVWICDDVSESKRTEDALQRVLAEQQALLNNLIVGIVFVRDRTIERCNRRFEELFGFKPGEAAGRSVRELYFTDEAYETGSRSYAELGQGETHQREEYLRRTDGSGFWCRLSGRALVMNEPLKGSVWLLEDISARRAAEARVRSALAEQELILANARVGISFVKERSFQRCNPQLEEMFGYAPGEMDGQSTRLIIPDDIAFKEIGRAALESLTRGVTYVDQRQLRRKDGSLFWCKVSVRAVDPERPADGVISIYEDVSADRAEREALERAVAERTTALKAANERLETEIGERRQAEARALHIADHDSLTGLPNRRLLDDRLTQALALSKRNRKLTAAMFVDLDRFKEINDTLGHAVGDQVLTEVANRLVSQLRVGDTVCRVGGDEFLVVLPEITRASDAAHVARKVIENLSAPIGVDGQEVTVTPSIGIAVYPDDGRDAEALIRNADAAMYHVKETGRANYQFFTEQMNKAAAGRLALETELRRAFEQGELRLQARPVIELAAGAQMGYAIALRWQHPSRGLLQAAEFSQLAEDTALILRIGQWMLVEACRWAVAQGGGDLSVAIHVSARQFQHPGFVGTIQRALGDSGLPAPRLELGLSEASVMQQPDVALGVLRKLDALGIALAIDGFGSGASNLATLKRYPLRKLKIDADIIAALPANTEQGAVAGAIIALGHALGLRVTATGVETDAQSEALRTAGCDEIESALAGAPIEIEAAVAASA
jgi:diguanylate cyclase (GGDEF)-like protein/PAS domain S-box-containing protein